MNNVQEFYDACKMLFEYFGWYSLLLVLGTTLIMIPLNLLFKKIMKKDSLERLRKTLSAMFVYVVAGGLVSFFTAVVLKQPLTVTYVGTASISCGLLSMLLWAIIKFVRDYGVLPLINVVLANKEAKKWLKEFGISASLVDVINSEITNYMKDKNIVSLDDYIAQETSIGAKIKTQLNGFVSSEKINDVTNNILQTIKSKLK